VRVGAAGANARQLTVLEAMIIVDRMDSSQLRP
jgi:hypothetical protein